VAMIPREVLILVVLVLVQILYSAVYPFVQQHVQDGLQVLPALAQHVQEYVSADRRSMADIVLEYVSGVVAQEVSSTTVQTQRASTSKPSTTKKAPVDGQKKPKRSREEDLNDAFSNLMQPQMDAAVLHYKSGAESVAAETKDVDVEWDVHRVTDAQVPFAYYFRLRVKNRTSRPCPLSGIARFYVLKLPGGRVFPIHRITEGPAGFTIGVAEEYKYSWMFYTVDKVLDASGGMLLERKDRDSDFALADRFVNTTFGHLQPATSRGTTMEMMQRMNVGHNFMGALDLRGVSYV